LHYQVVHCDDPGKHRYAQTLSQQSDDDRGAAGVGLPAVHRAIEIDVEAYWDGGFTANPPIFPLLHQCSARDIMMVLLHSYPKVRTPLSVDENGKRSSFSFDKFLR
jgi:predicted acylesterase/phospholipase RssA